jgi:hypothetical protein
MGRLIKNGLGWVEGKIMPGYFSSLPCFLPFCFLFFIFWLLGVGACFGLMASALTFRDDDHDERAIHVIVLFRFCFSWL